MHIGIIGCGWLGKDLAKVLLHQQHTVYGSKTTSNGVKELNDLGIKPVQLILQPDNISITYENHFSDCNIIIISITPRLRTRKNEEAIEELKLLSSFLKNNAPEAHIIYLNSTAIYDNHSGESTEESSNLKSPYLDFENIIKDHPRYTILRLAGLLGPDRIIVNRMAGKKREVSKTSRINLVAKEDVINAILTVVKYLPECNQEVFNVCSGSHPLKADFYTKMCNKANLPEPVFTFSAEKELKVVSNVKIRKNLGFSFQYENIEDYYNDILIK